MGVVIRQSALASIISYVGVALGAFITIWLYPKFLTTDEIGIYRIFISTGALLTVFAQIGIPNIIDRFFPKLTNPKANFVGFVLLYNALTFVVFALLFFSFPDLFRRLYQEKSPRLNDYYLHLGVFVFFLTWQGVIEALCRSQLKIIIPSLIKDVMTRVLVIALTLWYVYKDFDFDYFIIGITSFYGVNCLMLTLYLVFLRKLKIFGHWPMIERDIFKDVIKYGVFIVIGGASAVVINQVDIIMIGSMIDASAAGVYTTVLFIGAVIEIPRRTLAMISTPILSKAWAHNDLSLIQSIYQKSSINQQLVGSVIFLCIWSNIDGIFALIPNKAAFLAGKYVVFYIGLTKLIDMVMGVNNEIILQSKHYVFALISNVFLAFLIIVLNLIFIPTHGSNGAAFSTLIAVTLYNVLRFGFLWYRYRMHPFAWSNVILAIICLLVYGLISLLPVWELSGWLAIVQIAVRSLLVVGIVGGISLWLRISEDVNNIVRKLLGTRF